MRKMWWVLVVCVSLGSWAYADQIYLKSGRIVQGTIVEQTSDQIKIDIDGFVLSYYLDEVDKIEKDGDSSFSADVSKDFGSTEDLGVRETLRDPADLANQRQLVLRYMEVTGVKGQMNKSFNETIQQPPEADRRRLRQILTVEDVLEELVPVYAQYFSEQDLEELIRFYQSSLGQKVLLTAPLILQESAEKSLEYFQGKIE
jgi:hypothetical protein